MMASIYLPPIARKKKVDGWPRQNTSRVFPDMEDNFKQEDTSYKSEYIRHNVPPTPQRIASASRKNKPQSKAATFLRQNPRFVCEPICHVETTIQRDVENEHSWWPDETVQRPVKKPMYSLNSTSRSDYKNFSFCSSQTGHSEDKDLTFNPPKPRGAVGIVPSYKSESTNHISEKISYEHQFNSRLNPSHPVRGKRHGCFVWKVVTPVRNTHGRAQDRSLNARINVKDVSYQLTNTDTDDNMDAKAMVSNTSEKTTKAGNNSMKTYSLKENVPEVKKDAWITTVSHPNNIPNRPIHDVKQHEEQQESDGFYEVMDQEIKEGIKPSKPRHIVNSPPPHAN